MLRTVALRAANFFLRQMPLYEKISELYLLRAEIHSNALHRNLALEYFGLSYKCAMSKSGCALAYFGKYNEHLKLAGEYEVRARTLSHLASAEAKQGDYARARLHLNAGIQLFHFAANEHEKAKSCIKSLFSGGEGRYSQVVDEQLERVRQDNLRAENLLARRVGIAKQEGRL